MKGRIRYHDDLVTTKNFFFFNEIDSVMHTWEPGKNVNQEEANITNDIQMRESLSTIHEK